MRELIRIADSPFTVISGGEAGVERAALDALITPMRILNPLATCGGWCPAGRTAEDGTIPERYGLREVEAGGRREEAIERNLTEADGLLIIYFGSLTKHAEAALLRAIKLAKPYKLIDGSEITAQRSVQIVRDWKWDHSHPIVGKEKGLA